MTITGIYRATSGAYGFLSPDGGVEDLFIPPRRGGGAWDGDTVLAEPMEAAVQPGRSLARVVKVLSRAHPAVTGVLRREDRRWWLYPDNRRLPGPVLVAGRMHNAHAGDKAAVTLQSWAFGGGQFPSGTLAQLFGPSGELSSVVAAILFNYHIRPGFPGEVMEQADCVPDAVKAEDLSDRLDLRGETVITIDGASSRDFDDAVSLTREESGTWRLGVHIADVSHYVPENSPLDRDAWERGTSVYFAGRVVPMLPIALSNGVCSLNPRVDRLAVSCFITLNDNGEVLGHSLTKSVLRSAERMSYEDCNVLLEGGDPALAERYAHIFPMLRDMAQLARVLTKRRRDQGALFLESSELYVSCDEDGVPTGLGLRQSGASQSLIEEFMIAANKAVAARLQDAGVPCVYRVHQKPAADKLDTLRTALAPMGYLVGEGDGFALQKLLDRAAEQPEAPLVNTLVLRAQMRARYCEENLGHFGLAAPCYCHFTSPIRRYPDLMVHRILSLTLNGDIKGAKKLTKAVARAAAQSSLREQDAAGAEREIERCYAARFMADHIGERFSGAVSGVTRFGLFVTLSNGAEGMLPLSSLPPDDYRFEESVLALLGRRGSFRFGQPMEVLIAAADPSAGEITLALEEAGPSPVRPVRRAKPVQKARRKKWRPPHRVPKGRRRR